MRVPASARAIPVLPAVGSMMVPPFDSFPSRSARSIIPTPMRSLTEKAGLRNSSLTKRPAMLGPGIFVNWSIGVLPTRSRMLRTGLESGRLKRGGIVLEVAKNKTAGPKARRHRSDRRKTYAQLEDRVVERRWL